MIYKIIYIFVKNIGNFIYFLIFIFFCVKNIYGKCIILFVDIKLKIHIESKIKIYNIFFSKIKKNTK